MHRDRARRRPGGTGQSARPGAPARERHGIARIERRACDSALPRVKEGVVAHRAGYVAILGRAHVGKSTFLNALVGAMVRTVAPKPQTTRNRIIGIRALPDGAAGDVPDIAGLH